MSAIVAINLKDLNKIPSSIRIPLFAGRLDMKKEIDVREHIRDKEEYAIPFYQHIPPIEIATICDWIRSYNRSVGDAPTRLYYSKYVGEKIETQGTMHAIHGSTVLTVVSPTTNEILLNCPEIFPIPAAPPDWDLDIMGTPRTDDDRT